MTVSEPDDDADDTGESPEPEHADSAQSAEVRGRVTLEGGGAVPEGLLEVYFEDTADQDRARLRATKASIQSDGGSRAIDFSLSPPADPTTSPTLQIVARLERGDGWLLAGGSSRFEAGAPVSVALHAVMY